MTSSTEFERMEVCHAPLNPAVVYAAAVFDNRPALWRRSSNGGAFSVEKSPAMKPDENIAQAWYDFCFIVSPVNPNLIY